MNENETFAIDVVLSRLSRFSTNRTGRLRIVNLLIRPRKIVHPILGDPFLVDDQGLLRFWATVWATLLPADLTPATIAKKLNQLDRFYQHADSLLGPGRINNVLADLDVDALASTLEGYFFTIRNSSSITPACEERWQTAIQFVREISERQNNESRR